LVLAEQWKFSDHSVHPFLDALTGKIHKCSVSYFSLKQKPLDGRQEPSKEVDLDIFFTPSGRRRRKERARRPPAPDPYTGQGEYKEGLTTYEKIFKANSAKNKNMNIFIPF
jgi:hypothetical protein